MVDPKDAEHPWSTLLLKGFLILFLWGSFSELLGNVNSSRGIDLSVGVGSLNDLQSLMIQPFLNYIAPQL
jgi:hypothetical protein